MLIVMGSVDWSFLMQAQQAEILRSRQCSFPGLRDFGQVVSGLTDCILLLSEAVDAL